MSFLGSVISAAKGALGAAVSAGLGKAVIFNLDMVTPIPVQYNPESITISDKIKYTKVGAALQFNQVENDDFSVELFFDCYENSVVPDVRLLPSYIGIMVLAKGVTIPKTGLSLVPSKCAFIWGSGGEMYRGYINNVKQNFTLFSGSGNPLRCKMTINMTSHIDENTAIKNQGGPGCRKVRTVKEGERLDLLASRTLNDPYLWREIVNENQDLITNPRNYPQDANLGKSVVIPDYYAAGE